MRANAKKVDQRAGVDRNALRRRYTVRLQVAWPVYSSRGCHKLSRVCFLVLARVVVCVALLTARLFSIETFTIRDSLALQDAF